MDQVEREVGGGIGMGNTCKPMADSFQCMTKPTTIKKKRKKKENKTNEIKQTESLASIVHTLTVHPRLSPFILLLSQIILYTFILINIAFMLYLIHLPFKSQRKKEITNQTKSTAILIIFTSVYFLYGFNL